jgi:hypothetical protein
LETPLAAAKILERRTRYGIESLDELKPRKEESQAESPRGVACGAVLSGTAT